MGEDEAPPQPRRTTFAQKLDHLFRSVHPRDRGEFSYREVAKAIEEREGPVISASYLHQLRTGRKDNPTKRHIEVLATFFGVPPAYFFDDGLAEKVDAQLELLTSMRRASVRNIALRADPLSDESLRVIAEMVNRARQLEGVKDRPAGRGYIPSSQIDPSAAPSEDPQGDGE